MGRLVLNVDESEDQDYLRQNLQMLTDRIKVPCHIVRDVASGKVVNAIVDSPGHADLELRQAWEAVASASPRMVETLVPDDSPLRILSPQFSREQALIFDGIRYAAEMADVAYWRLFKLLQELAVLPPRELTTRQMAVAMLDAWSVVDSTNRLRDLVGGAPGIPHDTWWQLFMRRTSDIDDLRNEVQHQIDRDRIQKLVATAGQMWGFLSWAKARDGKYTGEWYMMSPGAVYSGDMWVFAGPALPQSPLPFGRVRLNAFGKEVYLGKTIKAVHDLVAALAENLNNGTVHPRSGTPAPDRDGGDIINRAELVMIMSDGTKKLVLPDVGA